MSTSLKQKDQNQSSTPCKDCIFAIYEDITQTGCKTHMLELYKNSNNVIEAYDEEKEFYVINGQVCPYKRKQNWKHASKGLNKQLECARKELSMNYEVVIVVKDEKSLQTTIGSLMEQTKRPSKIYVIVHQGSQYNKKSLVDCLVPWTIDNQFDSNLLSKDRVLIKNIIRKINSPLICYINSGTTFDDVDYFQQLENDIIDKQFSFGLKRLSKDEFIVPKICYSYFHFMTDSSVKSIMELEEGTINGT